MSLKLGTTKRIDFSNIKIYKITNTINNKIYIGQTVNSLKRRFNSHYWSSSKSILKKAMDKYGKENFIIEQIDKAHSKQEADMKEKYWIKKYNSLSNCKGYNVLEGGRDAILTNCVKIYCYEKNKFFNSIKECCEELNLPSASLVCSVCAGRKNRYKGYHFCYVDKYGTPNISVLKLNSKARPVKITCIETGEIFNKIVDASEKYKISISSISQCCSSKYKVKTAGGYHWEYYNKEVA